MHRIGAFIVCLFVCFFFLLRHLSLLITTRIFMLTIIDECSMINFTTTPVYMYGFFSLVGVENETKKGMFVFSKVTQSLDRVLGVGFSIYSPQCAI